MGERERTAWDDLKNEKNVQTHKLDFADLDDAFDGRFTLVAEDRRRDYGEQRFNMLVGLHEVILNITFALRPPKHRIISARLAS